MACARRDAPVPVSNFSAMKIDNTSIINAQTHSPAIHTPRSVLWYESYSFERSPQMDAANATNANTKHGYRPLPPSGGTAMY